MNIPSPTEARKMKAPEADDSNWEEQREAIVARIIPMLGKYNGKPFSVAVGAPPISKKATKGACQQLEAAGWKVPRVYVEDGQVMFTLTGDSDEDGGAKAGVIQ